MPRLPILLFSLLTALVAGPAYAVSLGDELILSRLGDPVEIEIEVLQWEDMDLDRVQISAATRAEYDVFALTWLPVLEDLRFNLVGPDLDGDVRVLVSSRDPVNEPFLELLLVLRWPGGSLRREYVLLFDPPGAPAPQASQAPPMPAPPVTSPQTERLPPAPAVTPAVATAAGAGAVPVPAAPAPAVVRVEPEPEPEPAAPEPAAPEPAEQEPAARQPVALAPEPPVPVPLQPQAVSRPLVVSVAPRTPDPEPVVEPEPEPVAEPEPEPELALPAAAARAEPRPSVIVVTPEPLRPSVAPAPAAATTAPPVAARVELQEPVPTPSPPEPPPPTVQEQADALPDARTQVAIDVETVMPPAPAPEALETTRRTYQIRSGDSLWNIARQFRPAGAGENLYQMLLSIHDLNRGAFINGNISLLKANAVLQIPDADDINRIEARSAEAEFEQRWDQGTQRFDAVQRGAAIPLFGNEAPAETNPDAEFAADLPAGEEAPNPGADNDGLIMVDQPNVPQPVQVVTATGASATPATAATTAAVRPAMPEPATTAPQTQTVAIQAQTVLDPDVTPTAVAVRADESAQSVQVTTRTRAQVAAELESEVAAMRARREAAEAIATQLNLSLQRAQAERSSVLGQDSVLLGASVLVLFVALLTAIVFSLKLAGDLRLQGSASGSATALERQPGPPWLAGRTGSQGLVHERKEPRMPEMEVVELHMPLEESGEVSGNPDPAVQTKGPGIAHDPDSEELFARLDGLLTATDPDSGKNA